MPSPRNSFSMPGKSSEDTSAMISNPMVCGSFRKRRLNQPNSAERLSSNAAISKMESMGRFAIRPAVYERV